MGKETPTVWRTKEDPLESLPKSATMLREGTGFAQSRASDRAERRAVGTDARPNERPRDDRMRRKLLVVDDDPYLTTQLRKLLESEELSVDTVSSAQEA